MKTLIILSFLTVFILEKSHGQANQIYSEANQRVKSNDRWYNALSYEYKGDIEGIIINLRNEFGREQAINENGPIRKIHFNNFIKPEWSDKKLRIELTIMSNMDKHFVTLICYDNKRHDLLTPDSETQKQIEEHFDKVFNSKRLRPSTK